MEAFWKMQFNPRQTLQACVFQCIFQVSVDDEQSDEEDDNITLRCNFVFLISSYVKLSFFYTTNYFSWYVLDMTYLFGVCLKKLYKLAKLTLGYEAVARLPRNGAAFSLARYKALHIVERCPK